MNTYFLITAALFPAMPLMMINFGNRYTTLSSLIRKIHDELVEAEWRNSHAKAASRHLKQIDILRLRLKINRLTSTLAGSGFIINLIALFISVNSENIDLFVTVFSKGVVTFASAMVLFIVEIQLATRALDTHIEDLAEIKAWQDK